MNPLTLILRERPGQSVNLSPLVPHRLAGKSLAEIGALELTTGNRKLRVEDAFQIEPGNPEHLVIRDSCERLTHIGQALDGGSITVEGDAGVYLALGMKGGCITVQGNADAYAASGMRDGMVEIQGHAGDFLAGALPGDVHGMAGGTVLVRGNAGDRAGDRMRRGMLFIGGSAGEYCGSRMLAGTLAVAGEVGSGPGIAMKRGTLLLSRTPDRMPVTFNYAGVHSLLFLRLLRKHLESQGEAFRPFAPPGERVRRYCGDLAHGGKGEILVYC